MHEFCSHWLWPRVIGLLRLYFFKNILRYELRFHHFGLLQEKILGGSELNNNAEIFKRQVFPISTTEIPIRNQPCRFCMEDKRKDSKKRYKTRWALAWHLSHFHRDERNFQVEFERVRGSINNPPQELKDLG